MTEQEQREECRLAVREYLAQRPALAMRPEAIQRGLTRGYGGGYGGYTLEAVLGALAFWRLLEPSQVTETISPAGSTRYHQITSAGVLAHERGQ